VKFCLILKYGRSKRAKNKCYEMDKQNVNGEVPDAAFLIEHMADGFAYCKMQFENGRPCDFTYLMVNPAFEKITGLNGVVNKNVTEVIPGIKENNPELFEIYGRVALTGSPDSFESYVPELKIWFAVTAYSPEEGYFVATFEDITERKNTEKALQKSSLLLNATQHLSKVGGWEYDVVTEAATWTEELYKLHDLPVVSDIDLVAESLKCYRPEDRNIISNAFNNAIEKGEGYDLEFPITTLAGRAIWIRTTCQPIYENGKVVRLIGNLIDITERKLSEQITNRSEANLRAILDNSPFLTWMKDESGRYITVNKAFANYLQLKDVGEVVGKTDFEVHPKELAEKYRNDDAEVMASRQQKHMEEFGSDGNRVHWVETYKTPIIDAHGTILT